MNSLGLEAGSQLTLVYGDVRILGTFRVGSRRGEVVVGEFEAGADFARAAPLFREFEDLVVDQVFSLVSSAAERIDGLRVRIGDPANCPGCGLPMSSSGAMGALRSVFCSMHPRKQLRTLVDH